MFKRDAETFDFTLKKTYDITVDDPEQSPIWVRPPSLLKDRIEGWLQIVGHTVQESLKLSDEIIFIDTLGNSGEYLVWEDDQSA